jgi:hypothetical protein
MVKSALLMLLFILMLLFVATGNPVLAAAKRGVNPSTITCKTVRSYVSQVGLARATSTARARGMTAAQERRARQCLKQTPGRAVLRAEGPRRTDL